ncbi:sensor histidine kinase [Spirillospora sp. CA-255316]
MALVLVTMLTTASVREGAWRFPSASLLLFTMLAWLPLLVRTRWPLAALAGAVTAECLHLSLVPFIDPGLKTPIAMGAYQPVPLATMVAAYTVAGRRPWRIGWTAGSAAAVVLLVVSVLARPLSLLATDMVMFNLVVIATGVGAVVTGRRKRVEQSERDRQENTRRHVVAERLRIARELHDVLAHRLTLVNAQAGVAAYLLNSDPKAASTALTDITQHTERALDELRATVGLLRQEGEPAGNPAGSLWPVPGLARLDGLLAEFRSAGEKVYLTTVGTPRPLPASVDLAAYRITQEALTNAAKHAPGAAAHLTLDWSQQRLDLRVENGPRTDWRRTGPAGGTGHGLIGMRERAHACGGQVTIQHLLDGGFLVHATLPVANDRKISDTPPAPGTETS